MGTSVVVSSASGWWSKLLVGAGALVLGAGALLHLETVAPPAAPLILDARMGQALPTRCGTALAEPREDPGAGIRFRCSFEGRYLTCH